MNLRVIQRFDRYLNDKNYKYSPLVFEVGRINGPESVTFLGEGSEDSVWGEKSVHMHDDVYLPMEPGNYIVRIRVLWNSAKYRTAVLAAYASETVNFTKCDTDTGTDWVTQVPSTGRICCVAYWLIARRRKSSKD